MARKFFYVCAGMLMLALSYHFGFSTASAQAPGLSVIGFSSDQAGRYEVMLSNGDIYHHSDPLSGGSPLYRGNFWLSGPTPTQRATWGEVKARYAPKGGSTSQPGTTER